MTDPNRRTTKEDIIQLGKTNPFVAAHLGMVDEGILTWEEMIYQLIWNLAKNLGSVEVQLSAEIRHSMRERER